MLMSGWRETQRVQASTLHDHQASEQHVMVHCDSRSTVGEGSAVYSVVQWSVNVAKNLCSNTMLYPYRAGKHKGGSLMRC